jgi:transcriptional regulator GlxA family with amidase domain
MTRTIGILIFPDFQLLDAAGPLAAFEVAARQSTPKAYRLRVLARTAGPVESDADGRGVRGGLLPRHARGRWRLEHALLVNCEATISFIRGTAAQVKHYASPASA